MITMIYFFKDYVNNYLNSADDKRIKDIIYKRYGIDNNKPHTLQEIANYHGGISRERIRQIETQHKRKLKKMIGERPYLYEQAEKINKIIDNERIVKKQDIRNLLNSDKDMELWENLYFDLMAIKEIKQYEIIISSHINKKDFNKNIKKIKNLLQKNIIPTKREDILKSVNRKYRKTDIDFMINIIDPNIKIINHEVYYQLKINDDWSAGDLAYLILWENNKPMTTEEIYIAINRNLTKKKQLLNMENQMIDSDKIHNIGTKTWALVEWGYNRMYIKDIMRRELIKNDRPMTKEELIIKVKEKRQDVKARSINAYCSQNGYICLKDGRVILEEWKENYIN